MPTPFQLLSACNLAYAIDTAGGWRPRREDLEGAGLEPGAIPICVSRIHAALVGRCEGEVVVAFRGTLPPFPGASAGLQDILADWGNNFRFASLPDMDGRVHEGFEAALDALWFPVAAAVESLAGSGARVRLTGHSKGGALATLAAARMRRQSSLPLGTVVTFGSPRLGDEAFRGAFRALGLAQVRYEYGDDPIPHLPPDLSMLPFLAWLGPEVLDSLGGAYVPVGVRRHAGGGLIPWYLDPFGLLLDHGQYRDGQALASAGYAAMAEADSLEAVAL